MSIFSDFSNLMAKYFNETKDTFSISRNKENDSFLAEGEWTGQGSIEKWELIKTEINKFFDENVSGYRYKTTSEEDERCYTIKVFDFPFTNEKSFELIFFFEKNTVNNLTYKVHVSYGF